MRLLVTPSDDLRLHGQWGRGMRRSDLKIRAWYLGQSGNARYLVEIFAASLRDHPHPMGTLLARYLRDRGPAAGVRDEVCTVASFARWAKREVPSAADALRQVRGWLMDGATAAPPQRRAGVGG
jgi:hypothetical protein